MYDLTIVIVAYNAEQTIARAIRSAIAAGPYPVLLVDDGSSDTTVCVAEGVGGEFIRVVKQPQNRGVGAARTCALKEIKTSYGMWLDADDEIMPDRACIMLKALSAGADIVYDGGILVDEETGEQIKELRIPDFMFGHGAEVRCLERNWYPMLPCGFRVAFAHSLGFDSSFECAEDYDFLLHAIMRKAKVIPLEAENYKYYHRANTISRNLEKTRHHIKLSLEKYTLEDFERRLGESHLSDTEQNAVLAGMALYRQTYQASDMYAQRIKDRETIIVPYALKAGLFADFISASACAAQGKWQQAHDLLQEVIQDASYADVWNNLGITLHHLGSYQRSRQAFQKALELMPGYYDAQKNLASALPVCWTTHPLRRQASRDTYSA